MMLLPNITDGFYKPLGLTVAGVNKELVCETEDFGLFEDKRAVLIITIKHKTYRLPAKIILAQCSKVDSKLFFTLKLADFWLPQNLVGASLELIKEAEPKERKGFWKRLFNI